jgi:DNA-binding CsgD family transcriptional regulator
VGRDTFASTLLSVCEATVAHDAAALMLFRPTSPPAILTDRLKQAERGILYGEYLTGVYLLSPFYRAAAGLSQPRAARVQDIAPEGFAASEYYQRYFARIGVADMLGVLIPVGPSGLLFASLSRATGQRGFTRADVGKMEQLLGVVSALALRHIELGKRFANTSPITPAQPGKFESALTRREADVVRLILAGHSSRSVAATLGISAETVRVHRRHIYAKLDVSSQAELFRRFLADRGA